MPVLLRALLRKLPTSLQIPLPLMRTDSKQTIDLFDPFVLDSTTKWQVWIAVYSLSFIHAIVKALETQLKKWYFYDLGFLPMQLYTSPIELSSKLAPLMPVLAVSTDPSMSQVSTVHVAPDNELVLMETLILSVHRAANQLVTSSRPSFERISLTDLGYIYLFYLVA